MTRTNARLGDLIKPAPIKRAGTQKYPILSITMHNGLIDQSKKFKKRIASKDTSQYRVVESGQLVVGFPIDEGLLSFQNIHPKAAVSPAYGIWDCDPHINKSYLERFLRSPRAIAYYISKMKGSTARRRNLGKDDFLNLPVPLPPPEEQGEIVDALDRAEIICAKRRQSIELLDELKQSVFIEIFGDPGTNPKQWPVTTIENLIESTQYGSSQKAATSGDLPILRMGNITSAGRISLGDLKYLQISETEEKYLVHKGDILFNRTNSPDLVGKTSVYRGPEPMAYAGYLIKVQTKEENNPDYISAYLNSQYGKLILRNMCKSIVGMANINAKELRGIKIPHPPLSLQNKFSEYLQKIEDLRSKYQAHLVLLDELFASVQQRAFDGTLWDDPDITA